MQTTQSAQSWLWPGFAPIESGTEERHESARADTEAPEVPPPEVPAPPRRIVAPPRERDARQEIARLRDEIEALVRVQGDNPRDTVDSALESVTRLQIVTANIDACGPPPESFAGSALVALADSRLRGHSDAIERGMTYTADNQLTLLRGEK